MINIQEILPEHFDPQSRVWIYQASRLFGMSEVFEIETLLEDFISSWKSHGAPVKGYANLFYGQFIVLMADESHTSVGGCSTDSSVHVIKDIEKKFAVDMFNRQNLAFYIKDKVQLLPLTHLNHAITNEFVTADTLYFNNLVATKEELINAWLIPAGKSWLSKKIEAMGHKVVKSV
jgi:hypothetical protein